MFSIYSYETQWMAHLICVPVVNFFEPTLTKPSGWLMVNVFIRRLHEGGGRAVLPVCAGVEDAVYHP